MGEYIKTGFIANFWVHKSGILQLDVIPEEIRSELAAGVVDNPESFDWADEGDRFVWTLKQDILEKRLPVFLKKYFNDFCDGGRKNYDCYCKPILDYLSTESLNR
jgi:hypothetical protein